MRRIEYELKQDGEPFRIASCDISSWNSLKDCPAVEMLTIACRDRCNKVANILTIACLDDASEEIANAFETHQTEFLKGQYGDWKLVQLQFEPGKVHFEYYNAIFDDLDSITLDINNSSVKNLKLKFAVPHQDQRPSTEYSVLMSWGEKSCCQSPLSDTLIEEHLPNRRSVFLLESNKPNIISVTECVDL